ncbi:hypothetical protein GGX14DRAFT_587692 [Mycena pura]|uniref:XRRM domain-containing protein n=1 Tax=Mycena pura TaxID=153505 RepID=A0AAD6UUC7_9AGAR|nr:hypothetical protein GGX14DRAFT_587692 [Mycena pura]
MSGFAFVPRKVARASKPAVNGAGILSVPTASIDKGKAREIPPLHAREHQPQPALASASASTSTSKSPYPDADFPALLCLSLSQYRLWLDPDLRRDIARCTRVRANDGFFPLRYLLDTPCPLAATRAPEAALAKALRAHGAAVVDVRMAVPSDGVLSSNQRRGGAFEIRPRFWDDADAASYPTSRVGWDGRTVYVENMPAECKTLPAVCRFILALLPPAADAGALAAHTRIQGITAPPHHSDEPGVEPKLKAFALITFARAADAEALLAAFPWQRTREPLRRAEAQARETADAAEGAARIGFRACSKARWDALNAEYLAYRARILADMKQEPEDGAASEAAPRARPGPSAGGSASARRGAEAVADTAPLAPALPYPPNCLVFVRNVDPETNKTALRAFFALPLGADAADAIDYVDFNKGMDSCYLRLTAAAHARRLVDHFAENPTVHARAGAPGSGGGSGGGGGENVAVAAELVQGTREGVYWERVPERVRAQAVQRARGLARGDGSGGAAVLARDGGEGGAGRERKRRRR